MKNLKKILALGCSAVLMISSFGGCSAKETTKTEGSEEITVIQNTLDELEGASNLVKHSDTAGKAETVYAILNADGVWEQTIVSEWLKNPEGKLSLSDSTELSDITVVKGDAQYTKDESGNRIVWKNDGEDIYYQGTSNKELPVDVKVSYELDGKNVNADELAGASGHLKITFAYTNRTEKQTTIQGEKRTIYQPFTMISGMMLDNSKAKNITVDHGSAINSGDDTLVFGVAMPGLEESLGLEEIDVEIPKSVTVEADVTDFSLMMTLTVASNTALSQLGLDDITSMDDLKSDMEQLTDGMQEILDGTSKLTDGAGTASDGAQKVKNGAVELKNGMDSLKEKTPSLVSGVDSLSQGAEQLSSGIDTIIGKNDQLNAGATQVAEGLAALNRSLNNDTSKQQMASLVSGSAAFSQGLSNASDGLSAITSGYNYSQGDLANLIAGLTQYAQSLTETGDPTNAAYAKSILTMVETYKALYQNVSSVQAGVSEINGSYRDIQEGIGSVSDNLSQISSGVSSLSEGAESLKDGVASYTEGISQASEGVKTLDEGLHSLSNKVPTLVSGINQLSEGTNTLTAGTASLSDGLGELVTGTGDLKDGVIKFDKEGIQKLADIVNGDLETYYERLKAVQDYAAEYTSYAGCESDVECSVKFIYKTDTIELKE